MNRDRHQWHQTHDEDSHHHNHHHYFDCTTTILSTSTTRVVGFRITGSHVGHACWDQMMYGSKKEGNNLDLTQAGSCVLKQQQ